MLLPALTALFPCCMWENESTSETLIAILLPLLWYIHMCHTTSVVVEFTYAGFILTSFPFVDVELIGREGWRTCLGTSSHKVEWLQLCRMPSGRDSSKMASSGLGLKEQEICPWVLIYYWYPQNFPLHFFQWILSNISHTIRLTNMVWEPLPSMKSPCDQLILLLINITTYIVCMRMKNCRRFESHHCPC